MLVLCLVRSRDVEIVGLPGLISRPKYAQAAIKMMQTAFTMLRHTFLEPLI